jgi:uncharacterized protein (DUF58 family)
MSAVLELTGAVDRQLRKLELDITRRLDGLLRGQHLGLVPGAGSELDGSREYRPGEDDTRLLDWAVTARTAVPHVRKTVADRELSVQVLVDATASMDFGTADLEKRQLAVGAVAAVGFLTAGSGNRLGADVMHSGGLRRIPPRAGRAHLVRVLKTLLEAPRTAPGVRGPQLPEALAWTVRSLRRRGLVVIVSDFLDDLGTGEPAEFGWESELRRLTVRHQVLAVEVLDPRELELPDVGVITLLDPESGRRREVSTGNRRLRERYAVAAGEHRQAVATALRRCGANHLVLRTDRDWVADIARHTLAQRHNRAVTR